MRRKIAIAAAIAATLVGAAACGNDTRNPAADPLNGEGKTIKVWLMVDAESGWKEVVEDANARFTAATKAQVKVEYQQWAEPLRPPRRGAWPTTDGPDVVELGNTDMPKYVFAGAFAEIDKSRFENSSTWLTGLSGPVHARRQGLLRALLRRRPGADLPHRPAREVGPPAADDATPSCSPRRTSSRPTTPTRTSPPSTCRVPTGTPPCRGCTARVAQIATKGSDGKWTGTLSDSKGVAGLQKWADLVKNYSQG